MSTTPTPTPQKKSIDIDLPPRREAADVSMVCPNCSAPLHSHRCKVVCKKCGFYLSCSDFY